MARRADLSDSGNFEMGNRKVGVKCHFSGEVTWEMVSNSCGTFLGEDKLQPVSLSGSFSSVHVASFIL